jgi:molecular chaperone DnaK (HSP70)
LIFPKFISILIYRKSFRIAIEKQEIKLSSILLTGGASKMDFIHEIIHQVFPNYMCIKDTEPGLCIAMGLARLGMQYSLIEKYNIPQNDYSQKNQDIKKVAEVTMSNNHVEIIGFDLGHGETALAYILNNNPEPQKLLLHNVHCQPTMIAYHPEGGVLFGKPALSQKATDFQIAFKKRPTSDPNYQKVMKDYVNAIYQHLLETNQLKKDDQNLFFIGCPSEWTDTEVAEYQKLLESSNLPKVSIIEESFAAMMQARGGDLVTLEELRGNVLVIDVGSSTTDCTLVKAGKHEEDGDFGIDLGAGLIDKAILDYSLSQNEDQEDIESVFPKFPYFRHRCEFKCRQAKEEYFCNPGNYLDAESKVDGSEKIQKVGIFEPIVYKQIIKNVTEQPLNNCLQKSKHILPSLKGVNLQKSWQDNFRIFLMETKQRLEKKGVKVNTILLTGGASKMDFIPEIVHQIFSNCKCMKDTEPSFCIAMGLARWGKKSINSIHFLEEVEQFLQKDLPKIFTDKVASLRSKLTENLVEGLSYKVIKPALLDWRNRSGIYTINNLESVIISRVKTWLEGMGGQEVIKKAISNWVNDDLVPSMKEKTDIICKKYGLGLDQLVPYSLTYNPTADKLTSETLNLADPTVMTPIINWIIGIVVTVITLFLATTVIGLIIGLFVLFGLQGWAEETIKDWDIPKGPRGWVNNEKISEMTSEIKGKLTGGVEKAIAEDIKFIDKILDQVKDGLSKEVRKQADSVKILIS